MICEDLIREIFEKLPVKSLLRFRCLSKSWCSRISSPDFIRMHSLRSCSQKVFVRHYNKLDDNEDDFHSLHSVGQLTLCQNSPKYVDGISIKTVDILSSPRFKVINSCNGILCLQDYKNGGIISLWNPSIRRKVILPDPQPCYSVAGTRVTVGLGFDPISNDYKIVRISYLERKPSAESTLVYSMKTRVWSSIASPTAPFNHIKSRACFLNGILHWVAVCYTAPRSYYIMTFNLTTHVFGKITLRKPIWITRNPTIINGCLAVISYETIVIGYVWVMKDYNNVASWYELFKIYTHYSETAINVMQVDSTNGGYFLINYYRRGLQVYNHATRVKLDFLKHTCFKVYMETCLETLELLDESSEFES